MSALHVEVRRSSTTRRLGVTVRLADVTATGSADGYQNGAVERATRAALAAWVVEARARRVLRPPIERVEVNSKWAGAHDATPARDIALGWARGGA